MTAVTRNLHVRPLIQEIYRLHNSDFGLVPLGGGPKGKAPLCKFAGKELQVEQVLALMRAKGSSIYGIRLHNLVVVDVDEYSEEIIALVKRRFGESPVQVATPRGYHFYFKKGEETPPNLRAEGLAIDIKTGRNSYVAGPSSIRPDGGEYNIIAGQLSNTILPVFKDATYQPVLTVQSTGLVPEGDRNLFLWQKAREYAPVVLNVEELVENLKYDRDTYCDNGGHKVHDAEIIKIAKWGWSRRTKQGGLYQGRNSPFQISRATMDALLSLPNGTEAFAVHSILMAEHGHVPGKRFSLSFKGMKLAGRIPFGRNRFYAARKTLIELRLLIPVGKYTVGKASQQYQLAAILPEFSQSTFASIVP